MKAKLLFHSLKLVLFTILAIIVNQARNTEAAAFYNRVYTDVNRAFAGDVAAGRDASTVHANPAGMMLLERVEVKGGGGFVFSVQNLIIMVLRFLQEDFQVAGMEEILLVQILCRTFILSILSSMWL